LKCGKEEEFCMRMTEYKRPLCCEEEMQRIFTHSVVPDLQPYLDENIGTTPEYVKSKQHRKELMKKHGVYEKFGKGWV
jgi:hypothetical protein